MDRDDIYHLGLLFTEDICNPKNELTEKQKHLSSVMKGVHARRANKVNTVSCIFSASDY